MIIIYTSNSCASCRKAVKWLTDNNIEFKEINFFNTPITKKDILKMLENSENGFEDIISRRSKVFTQNNLDIDSMSFNELVDFIIKHPSILKRPIIIDEKKFQVGYNDEEIRMFIPAEIRKELMCKKDIEDCNYTKEFKYSFNRTIKHD